jgi:hypothetical protein
MNFISTKPLCETIGKAASKRPEALRWFVFLGGRISLQESGVRVLLHLQQVRNFEHAIAAAETFANSLAFGVRIGHEISGQRHESWVFDD